jgi:predicted nucleic acid-binding protein
MTGKVFFFFFLLLYAEFKDDSDKYRLAKNLLTNRVKNSSIYVSTQIINEFYVNALRKGKTSQDIQNVLQQFFDDFNILSVSTETVQDCWRVFNRYKFSYWDSLIVASALESQSTILYTEDLSNGQIIDNTLKVVNPFER